MATAPGETKTWLRETARASVRDRIADEALRLFDENGFDATTVDDLAAAIGISARSFFRYFPAKEDVVIADPVPPGALLRDAVSTRPMDEDARQSLRAAFDTLLRMTPDDADRGLRTMRVMMSTASLRARNVEKHLTWAAMLEPVVAARLGGQEATRLFRAQSLIHSTLACFDVALAEWTRLDGSIPANDLFDRAFDTVHAPLDA